MGNGIGRTVCPVELLKSVQLNCAAKDVTIKRQCLTSCSGKFDVGRRVRYGSNLSHRSMQQLEGRIDRLDASH